MDKLCDCLHGMQQKERCEDAQGAGMTLREKPVRPEWNLKYVGGHHEEVPESWDDFVDTAYWDSELQD